MTADELRAKGYTEVHPGVWAKADPGGVLAIHEKPTEGVPLECALSRETESRNRLKIRFTVYSTQPADWDAWHIKELQDVLIKAGVLDGDDWDVLQGEVVSEKVCKKSEERTEITIEQAT